jgi:3',5'-cyclic AMP phosphodiesterase CpdA
VLINAETHVIVYGDSRTGHAQHQEIVNRIRRHRPAAIFHSGDLVNNGLVQSDWDMFFTITDNMLTFTEFYPAIGNHERQSPLFFEYFDLPGNEQWYSVDINKIHFIVLNSCIEYQVGSGQYQWLEQNLMAVPDTMDFIAVVMHHPPFSTGSHDDEHNLQESFVPLFEQYGVDIVFNGHNHCYERLNCNGIYYIVTGGGGAPLHNQVRELECSQLYVKSYNYCKLWYNENGILIRVYDNNDELIDRFQLIPD